MQARHGWVLSICGLLVVLICAAAPGDDKRRRPLPVRPAVEPDTRRLSTRRPLPPDRSEIYDVVKKAETVDSQGTAFTVDRRGVWATAGHATLGCVRVTLGKGDRESSAMPMVLQGMDSDVSLIFGNERTHAGLPLEEGELVPGITGYHMGFPSSQPTIVASLLIGTARARSRDGSTEPLLVWSETWRSPDSSGPLDGISGGPVIAADGRVAGVVSLVTSRRGRIFTVPPAALQRLVRGSTAVAEKGPAVPIASPEAAVARFRGYVAEGLIRQAYCGV